jgi:hypothetical protein
VWARVKDDAAADAIDDGAAVSYDATTGEVSSTGTALPNAVFRSKAVAIANAAEVMFLTGGTVKAAVVELHHPFPGAAGGGGNGGGE